MLYGLLDAQSRFGRHVGSQQPYLQILAGDLEVLVRLGRTDGVALAQIEIDLQAGVPARCTPIGDAVRDDMAIAGLTPAVAHAARL